MKPAKHDIEFVEAFRDEQKRNAKLKRLYLDRLLSRMAGYLAVFMLVTDFVIKHGFENEQCGLKRCLL